MPTNLLPDFIEKNELSHTFKYDLCHFYGHT